MHEQTDRMREQWPQAEQPVVQVVREPEQWSCETVERRERDERVRRALDDRKKEPVVTREAGCQNPFVGEQSNDGVNSCDPGTRHARRSVTGGPLPREVCEKPGSARPA